MQSCVFARSMGIPVPVQRCDQAMLVRKEGKRSVAIGNSVHRPAGGSPACIGSPTLHRRKCSKMTLFPSPHCPSRSSPRRRAAGEHATSRSDQLATTSLPCAHTSPAARDRREVRRAAVTACERRSFGLAQASPGSPVSPLTPKAHPFSFSPARIRSSHHGGRVQVLLGAR
jgi:hypothetical protein